MNIPTRRRTRTWIGVGLSLASLGSSYSAFANYDTNLSGVADGVYTYPSGVLLIHLTNQPTSHPSCNPTYFAIDPATLDANAMSRMYARLLTSYAIKEPINIGYDSQGDCAAGYIHVWRIG